MKLCMYMKVICMRDDVCMRVCYNNECIVCNDEGMYVKGVSECIDTTRRMKN